MFPVRNEGFANLGSRANSRFFFPLVEMLRSFMSTANSTAIQDMKLCKLLAGSDRWLNCGNRKISGVIKQ